MADITSANAVLILSVPAILPTPTQLQGFSTEDIYTADDVEPIETQMGVDGTFSGGVRYVERPVTYSFKADSPSIAFFEAWDQSQLANLAAYPAAGNLTLPSIGKSFTLITGFLTRLKPIPDGRRVLMAQQFRVTWGRIIPVPVGSSG